MTKKINIFLSLILAAAFNAYAEAPNLLTYQGRLKEAGQAVTGNRSVEILLCNDESAGTCHTSGAQPVAVSNGLFRSTFAIPGSANFGAGNWWLEIKIGADTLAPREQFTSNAYAMFAATAAYAANISAAEGSDGVYISSNLFITGEYAGISRLRLSQGVQISSEASPLVGAGVNISSNVYIVGFSSAGRYYGDGSALTGITSPGIADGSVTRAKLAQDGCAEGQIFKFSSGLWVCGSDDTGAGGTVTGAGIAGRVTYWSGTSTLGSNANLFWDNANSRLGIGNVAPTQTLDVTGNIAVSGTVDGRDVAADGTKLDGVAANANNYSHPNHTGDITSTGDGATVLANGAVTLAKMDNLAANSMIGNNTGGAAAPIALSAADVRTLLNVADGATAFDGATAVSAVEGEATLDLTGDVTVAAAKSLAVDTVAEKTAAAGVTIDGVLVKDGAIAKSAVGLGNVVNVDQSNADNITSGTLAVARGGTGAATLTGVLKGNGTGAFTAMTGTAGRAARWSDANTLAASSILTDNNANIGVGSTAPDQKLTVAGNISLTGVVISSGTGDSYFAGSVGIGTAAPQGLLHLAGDAARLSVESTDVGNGAQLDLDYSIAGGAVGRTFRLRSTNLGAEAGFVISNVEDVADLLAVDKDGNVGVGTTNPGYKLDVQGGSLNASAGLCIGGDCKASWAGAGDNLGSHNASQDLQLNWNNIYTVSTITAAGHISAAAYQINGSTVLAIPFGTGSLAIGIGAGRLNTGGYNSLVGYQAGYANTSGAGNSFFGYAAGNTNSTGEKNSFVGAEAGFYNSAGGNNSFIGYYAGNSNETGGNNSFVGAYAGNNNQTGSANAILGAEAGGSGGAGSISSSTIMGYQAGNGLTTGSDNILLGFRAGDNLQTGGRNIIIGYDQDATAPTISDELNIGGLLRGNLNAGSIGIGFANTLPLAALDVRSTGTASNIYAQVWRNSDGAVISSMSSTGLLAVSSITTTGNVGIGTESPTAALHVIGVSSVTASITVNGVEYAYVPRGMVNFFNLAACPTGWTELTAAQGRYLVGLPSGGTLAGTSGTALTELEDRPAGGHSHGITDPGHSHSLSINVEGTNSYVSRGSSTGAGSVTTGSNTTGISVASYGVAGTNAPYIQLLVCQKD